MTDRRTFLGMLAALFVPASWLQSRPWKVVTRPGGFHVSAEPAKFIGGSWADNGNPDIVAMVRKMQALASENTGYAPTSLIVGASSPLRQMAEEHFGQPFHASPGIVSFRIPPLQK